MTQPAAAPTKPSFADADTGKPIRVREPKKDTLADLVEETADKRPEFLWVHFRDQARVQGTTTGGIAADTGSRIVKDTVAGIECVVVLDPSGKRLAAIPVSNIASFDLK